ncbi:hypothetical protein ASD11_03360 [Aeromicrobium sp. Root495]|uniref:class I SAM-dependent methyltransferase n=1 Tax=Aeromicrobium sp. Root495 TaxID=1736550 RepID=UPI0007016D56|nr:class I SAM-dependent methyltransferase [Aeromicrobium sp. Root495]KQY58701.1 hypothetical protein ASD11_03360 [Aeromicrobium sp. Root495]
MTTPSDPGRASSTWRADHPWAVIYDRVSGSDRLGALLWRVGAGSSLSVLHGRARDALVHAGTDATVLDIPCGGGVVLRDVPRGFAGRYVAADISPAMLRRTAEEAEHLALSHVEITEADVQALAFDHGTFDLVVAFTSLHCFPDPALALREIARVLRPGGRLSGSAFLNDAGPRFTPVILAGRALGLLGPSGTRKDLARWLADVGLVDVEITQAGGLTYFGARKPERAPDA